MGVVTPREIVDYWIGIEDECALAVDWYDAHERCWRCGYKSKLEVCHVVPESLGGATSPSNLVLLCRRCHREAPNHQNPRYMWIWLKATCVDTYNSYWTLRALEEFKVMFGRELFDWFDRVDAPDSQLAAEFNSLLKTEFARAITHFGEGRLNPSTIACVMAESEQELARGHGITLRLDKQNSPF